ncbi:hypothetical protein DFP72DRAFT_642335 [Ephemerocybe angulata]|uniref:CFEM domain-containing protein n=1 Tax=Ephemerocybe angulata TaxID=980116 RepID=A0A8H6HGR8_9AGAR|nr:hypothetical protein DFP72DRAFT_642335 [Tulosesus angulatus]
MLLKHTLPGLVSIVSLAASVGAQFSGGGIPECGSKCATAAAGFNPSCASNDVKCLCGNSLFVNAVYACIATECDKADQSSTVGHLSQVCAAASSSTVSSSTSTSTTASSTTTSASSSSSTSAPTSTSSTTTSASTSSTPTSTSTSTTSSSTTSTSTTVSQPTVTTASATTNTGALAGASSSTSTVVVVQTVGASGDGASGETNNILNGAGKMRLGGSAVAGLVALVAGIVLV